MRSLQRHCLEFLKPRIVVLTRFYRRHIELISQLHGNNGVAANRSKTYKSQVQGQILEGWRKANSARFGHKRCRVTSRLSARDSRHWHRCLDGAGLSTRRVGGLVSASKPDQVVGRDRRNVAYPTGYKRIYNPKLHLATDAEYIAIFLSMSIGLCGYKRATVKLITWVHAMPA